MVEFSKADRIEQIKKLIEEQQKKEADLSKKADDLKKEQEALEKQKQSIKEENKKIDELLEDALNEEAKDKDDEEKIKAPRRTDVQLQSSSVDEIINQTTPQPNSKPAETIEPEEKKSEPFRTLYRRTPQNPVVAQLYKSLETVYEVSPTVSQQSAGNQQRAFYRELRSIADNMSQQQQEVAPGQRQRMEAYGQEVEVNPNSRSVNWQKLHDLARRLAESAGPDEKHYHERSEALLNQLRQDFVERAYHKKKYGEDA